MKFPKRTIIITILISILCISSITFYLVSEFKIFMANPNAIGGKDTLAILGNGKFSILTLDNINDNTNTWVLRNTDTDESIDNITIFKKKENNLYTIGENGYTKLNYESGELIQSNNINDFNESDIKLFKKMADKKTGRIKKSK